jgi:DUF4097 and DUF4098 domain-containing protein YvlB
MIMFRNSLSMIVAALLAAPWTLAEAATAVRESRPADPQGVVDISNVSGSVEVSGWNKAEVEVTGSMGKDVDRVEVSSEGTHTSVSVILHSTHSWNSDGSANLVIHVPSKSSVSCSLVSADFKVSALQGDLKLQSVSGEASGDIGGDLRANVVSGDLRMSATASKSIEVKNVSGNVELSAGGGEVQVTTVSGDAKLKLGTLTRGRFHTVSGNLTASLGLGPEAQLDAESVSGDIRFEFAGAPAADFDVETFSGDIDNCFGPKPEKARHGSGSRLMFKNGEGHASVRIDTKSGDVRLCAK